MPEAARGQDAARRPRLRPAGTGGRWRGRAWRGWAWQLLLLAVIAAAVAFLAHNTQQNMRARGIPSGFDFLGAAAGFDIGESPIAYDPSERYAKALWVGVLNTLRVAALGIVATTVLGVAIGVGRFSRNALLRGLCQGWVELFRNVPLLVQLLMWYLLFVEAMPPPQQAAPLGGGIYLSKGGLSVPWPVWAPGHVWMAAGVALGLGVGWLWRRRARRRVERGEAEGDRWALPLAAVAGGALAGWAAGGAPREWSMPEQLAFMVDGGATASAEFLTLLVGLVVYTSAFVAEVVRSGIQSVGRGQVEAAAAIGLSRRQQMRLVVLPQALRVIVPPLTNQYLNLTKNSSLAVAIGYPDVVSIANTTINQSGRAVECVVIIMAVYLATSLATSAAMGLWNRRVAIRER